MICSNARINSLFLFIIVVHSGVRDVASIQASYSDIHHAGEASHLYSRNLLNKQAVFGRGSLSGKDDTPISRRESSSGSARKREVMSLQVYEREEIESLISTYRSKHPRIVGGTRGTNNTILRMGFVIIVYPPGITGLCSATILDSKRILTAAHCFFNNDSDQFDFTEVYVATAQLKRKAGSVHVGRYVDIYRTYNTSTLQNDLAIITLNGRLNKAFKPVIIPNRTFPVKKGSTGTASGYGIVKHNGRIANVLRQVDLMIRPVRKCKKRFTQSDQDTIIKREVICTVDPDFKNKIVSKGTCSGDSGGPLFVQTNSSDLVQVGIVSFGEENCGGPGSTSWFTNVRSYSNAIAMHAKGNLTEWKRVSNYNLNNF